MCSECHPVVAALELRGCLTGEVQHGCMSSEDILLTWGKGLGRGRVVSGAPV